MYKRSLSRSGSADDADRLTSFDREIQILQRLITRTRINEAKRLLKFLDYFLPISPELIPKNSIIREFIGGSCLDVG